MSCRLKFLQFLTCIVGIFFLSGCAGSARTEKTLLTEKQQSPVSEAAHNRALRHFIEGAGLDAKGLYADAILEYQEALKAEPNAAAYFAISKDYAIRGNLDNAAEYVKNAISLDPSNIYYRNHLVNIYISTSRIDSATAELEKMAAIDSTRSETWYTLAGLYELTRPKKAVEIYEKLLNEEGDQAEILFQSAKLYMSLGEYNKAAEKYERILQNDPGNKLLEKQLSDVYIKAGRADSAITLLNKIVEEDSSDIDAFILLADAYASNNQTEKSVALYDGLIKRDFKDPEMKMRIGIGFFGLTRHDSSTIPQVRDLFEKMRGENPGDWRPYWYLGAISLNMHRDSEACDYFRKVTTIEENNPDAWWLFGSCLFTMGKYDSLLDILNTPQLLFENDFRFYLLEGIALTRLGKNEEAVVPLEKAYALNPRDLNTLSTLALTLDGLRRYQESDKIYEEGLKFDSTSALLLNNYSYSLAERGLQLDRSLKMSKQAITAEPENAAYLDTYGWILFKMERYREAAVYIEKSVRTGNASAVVHEHLGDIYMKLGEKEKALEKWKEASEMDPDNSSTKTKIDEWK